jgi:hypothetical protein
MENIFEEIIKILKENDRIPLKRKGHFYTYIGISKTKINGIEHDSIAYRISEINKKRVSKELIVKAYEYFIKENEFPEIEWYRQEFPFEIKSRPCNKSVAKGLIEIVLKK